MNISVHEETPGIRPQATKPYLNLDESDLGKISISDFKT